GGRGWPAGPGRGPFVVVRLRAGLLRRTTDEGGRQGGLEKGLARRGDNVTANQLIQILTSATFLLVFIAVLVRAIRHPSRESIDIALFFSAPAFSIAQAPIAQALGVQSPTLSLVSGALILA